MVSSEFLTLYNFTLKKQRNTEQFLLQWLLGFTMDKNPKWGFQIKYIWCKYWYFTFLTSSQEHADDEWSGNCTFEKCNLELQEKPIAFLKINLPYANKPKICHLSKSNNNLSFSLPPLKKKNNNKSQRTSIMHSTKVTEQRIQTFACFIASSFSSQLPC